jgi:RimJ/RimL family protein N-acetyltransferase
MGWQLHPAAWAGDTRPRQDGRSRGGRSAGGRGYATEAGRALARWAFGRGAGEVFAVVRPANKRAEATVRRIGMDWVGETGKYYDLRLQVFRLRPADLDSALPRVD